MHTYETNANGGERGGGHSRAPWRRALVVCLAALAAYGTTALVAGQFATPGQAYFDQLARAFLDGRLHLAEPTGTHDLTRHQGRWYVPFPPLPAVLMLPWVALFTGINTVAFSILFGAANVTLVFLLLETLARCGWIPLRNTDRLWLTLLFAMGSVHWYVAVESSVWFLGHVCTVTFIGLAAWSAASNRSPWLTGAALALAMWGRPNVIFTWPLLLGLAAEHFRANNRAPDRRIWMRWTVACGAPLLVSMLGLMTYNVVRFGDPLDFGYANQKADAEVLGDLHAHGQFSPLYVPRNLETMLLALPTWDRERRLPVPDDRGMSLLLTTPALIYLFGARRSAPFVRGAWIALGLLLVPLLTYYNTGWRQFGYRFSLDFMVPVVVLLAATARSRVTWPMRTLILLGVAVNAWGVWWWFTA